MNQSFSFHRFGLLVKMDFAENGKKYLIASGLIIGLMLLLMNPLLDLRKIGFDLIILHVLAIWVCILGSSLFTSSVFDLYHTPTKGIIALMVPASQLEKFLTTLLINLGFVLLFLVSFWTIHYWSIVLANTQMQAGAEKLTHIPRNAINFINYSYFLIQAAVFLGSIYFTKASYIKTIAVFLIVLATAFLLNLALVVKFATKAIHVNVFPFSPWSFWVENHLRPYSVTYPDPMDNWVWAFLMLLIVALWYVAYVRLKEKEI